MQISANTIFSLKKKKKKKRTFRNQNSLQLTTYSPRQGCTNFFFFFLTDHFRSSFPKFVYQSRIGNKSRRFFSVFSSHPLNQVFANLIYFGGSTITLSASVIWGLTNDGWCGLGVITILATSCGEILKLLFFYFAVGDWFFSWKCFHKHWIQVYKQRPL